MIEPAPVIFLSFLVGSLAGLAGCAIGLLAFRHLLPRLLADVEFRAGVDPNDLTIPIHVMAPQGVRIPITVAAPEAVNIPVELAPTTSAAAGSTNPELAARILAEVPDLGPRALARILQVTPSTAHGYISRTAPAPAPAAITGPQPDPVGAPLGGRPDAGSRPPTPNFQESVWWTTTPTPTGGTDDSIE